jgi:hypothetical protein
MTALLRLTYTSLSLSRSRNPRTFRTDCERLRDVPRRRNSILNCVGIAYPKLSGLREDQTTNKVVVSAAMGRLLRKALVALVSQKRLAGKNSDNVTLAAPLQRYAGLVVKLAPISLRIRSAEATRNARKLLCEVDEAELCRGA